MGVDMTAAVVATRLDSAVRQLDRLGDGLRDAAAEVRSLVALVHWQAASATVFHERAETFARHLAAAEVVLDDARRGAAWARDRAAFSADIERLRA